MIGEKHAYRLMGAAIAVANSRYPEDLDRLTADAISGVLRAISGTGELVKHATDLVAALILQLEKHDSLTEEVCLCSQ